MIIIQKHPQVYENITKMIQMITLQILNDLNTSADGNTKDVETIVPLKYLSNLCRTLEMPSISRKRNLIFTLSST